MVFLGMKNNLISFSYSIVTLDSIYLCDCRHPIVLTITKIKLCFSGSTNARVVRQWAGFSQWTNILAFPMLFAWVLSSGSLTLLNLDLKQCKARNLPRPVVTFERINIWSAWFDIYRLLEGSYCCFSSIDFVHWYE